MLMPTHMASGGGGGGGGGALNVSASPTDLYGFKYGYGSIRTSGPVAALATNAVGSVTYTWEYVYGDTEIQPDQGGKSSTRFWVYADLMSYTYQAVWRCKAVDSASNEGYSNPVYITIESLLQDGGQIP